MNDLSNDAAPGREATLRNRMAMYGNNRLQIGLFGANCSSGRAVTMVPERWSGNWPDNRRLARMADEAGIDFLLPIGRWKGYGGDTDYQGATLETITWASGLLASTSRITVFGTVHAPLFNPVIAAKEMVTADQIGEGRFGLNIVVGWNEGEFQMFGVTQREHEQRYEYAQEWIDVIKMIWSDKQDFDFEGTYLKLKGIRGKPKPCGGTRPVIMNAGASPTGQAFAIRNCDAFFLQASRTSLDETAQRVAKAKDQARQFGRELGVYTVGVITCKPTRQGGEGLLSPLHRRACRLVGGRRHPGPQEHQPADGADGGIPHPAQPLRPGHGRAADRRRSRRRRAPADRPEQGRADRHRRVVRQLHRRAAVLLRRGAAAVGTCGGSVAVARMQSGHQSRCRLSGAIEGMRLAELEVRFVDKCGEAPPDHSITSSATASKLAGMVKPSAFAVLRLITSWNFVGCSTGRSVGRAPFRIFST